MLTVVRCFICTRSHPGSVFVQCEECGQVWCNECIGAYTQVCPNEANHEEVYGS